MGWTVEERAAGSLKAPTVDQRYSGKEDLREREERKGSPDEVRSGRN